MPAQVFNFAAGNLWGVRTDIASGTPFLFGALQNVSIEMSADVKPLYGASQFPIYVQRGKGKITGKASFAELNGRMMNDLFWGQSSTTGSYKIAQLEGAAAGGTAIPAASNLTTNAITNIGSPVLNFAAGAAAIPPGTSVTGTNVPAGAYLISSTATTVTISANVTVAVASGTVITFGPSITVVNAATFADDLGVVDAVTGYPFFKVASAPAIGQYSVSANGGYSFNAADGVGGSGRKVAINYSYQPAGAVLPAQNTIITNPQLGFTPTWQPVFAGINNGVQTNIKFFNAVSTKLSLATKQDDWTIPDLEFQCFADSLGRLFQIGTFE